MTWLRDQMERSFFHPRYWHIWCLLGVLRAVSFLPYRMQTALGQNIGTLGRYIYPERKRIADINLEICFPEWSESSHSRVLNQHFKNLGMALLELGMCWWWSDKRLRPLANVEGLKNLHTVLAEGKGAILLAGHFTTLEIISRILHMHAEFHPVYRKNNNPLLDHIITSGRINHCGKVIPHDNVRSLLRSLRHNIPVLYIPDRNYGKRNSIFVPFFNIPTATTPATSRVAKLLGTPVLPIIQQRLPDNKGYRLVISERLHGFPSEDPVADTIRMNSILEEQIRNDPANYLWIHRRFKSRPDGEKAIY